MNDEASIAAKQLVDRRTDNQTIGKEGSMKLVVLGATGGIGVEVVRQAIARGHSVTALVRKPEPLNAFAGHIRLVQGNLMDAVELGRTLEGHDAVLSAFGPRLPLSKTDADLLQRFAATLTNAMLRTAVRRAVIVSTAFLFRDSIIPPTYLFGRLFFPSVIADASAMEQIVTASELDWTLVRPPQLTDKPRTGRYRVREGHLPVFGFKIARADVADFMIRCLENHASRRKIVGVCN
jgi:putative NADH-flavin reductase